MIVEIDLKPELEAKLKAHAQARGVSVEALIASVIEGMNGALNGETAEDKDPRIATMRETINDELFLADLAETMEDFKYVDAEHKH